MPYTAQHVVLPQLPTALANRTHVDLPGHDVWLCSICIVWIVPTALDVSRFDDAVSRALQIYPHAAGQLRCADGRWSIELTNTAVPIDVDYGQRDTTADAHLQGDWISQEDISWFLSPQPTDMNLVNDKTPLLRFKLAFLGDETSIGISWHHSLGDVLITTRFMHTISQFYQGLPAKFAAPTFEKHHFPPPEPSVRAKFLPHMAPFVDLDNIMVKFSKLFENLGHLQWRIDIQELEKLRSVLSSNAKGKRLSIQHCLIAYIAIVLNHCQSGWIRTIRYVYSYRDSGVPFVSENVASTIVAETLSEVSTDIAQTVFAIRDAANDGRQAEYIYNWASVLSNLILESANAGKMITPDYEDQLMVNAFDKIDFHDVHFGCHAGIRYHVEHPLRQLRTFKPNPERKDDGAWQTRQSIEFSMGVPLHLKPMIEETLSRGVRYMLDKYRARL